MRSAILPPRLRTDGMRRGKLFSHLGSTRKYLVDLGYARELGLGSGI